VARAWRGLRLIFAGALLGLGGAIATARLLAAAIPELPARDPMAIAAITIVLVAVCATGLLVARSTGRESRADGKRSGMNEKHQTPSSKHQRNPNVQIPISPATSAALSLSLGGFLVFGTWCLMFGSWVVGFVICHLVNRLA